jgi:hypothetical protein
MPTHVVTLEPSTEKLVPFTITAPGTPEVGENDGCIVIQEKNGPTQTLKQKGGPAVQLSFRTAIRMAMFIPGKITKNLSIVDYKATQTIKKDFLLHPEVKNTGNVSVDAELTTQTTNIFGLNRDNYKQTYPILRGATSEWNIPYKRPFWGGFLTSHFMITYDSNIENTLGVQTDKITTTVVSKKIHFISWPTTPALFIELGIIGALTYGYFRTRQWLRERKWVRGHWVEYRVKSQEDINTIARKYGISWQKLAKTNKLKPPYTLHAGDRIKVPPKRH